jgi:hypothetical protein
MLVDLSRNLADDEIKEHEEKVGVYENLVAVLKARDDPLAKDQCGEALMKLLRLPPKSVSQRIDDARETRLLQDAKPEYLLLPGRRHL